MQNSINPFNIRPANRVNNISEYYFSKKLKEIAELNARGLDIISLGIGGPDRPPHPETIETLCTESRKSDVHGYQPYIGLPELRRAFADWYNRWYNVTLDPQKEIQPLIDVFSTHCQDRASAPLRHLRLQEAPSKPCRQIGRASCRERV